MPRRGSGKQTKEGEKRGYISHEDSKPTETWLRYYRQQGVFQDAEDEEKNIAAFSSPLPLCLRLTGEFGTVSRRLRSEFDEMCTLETSEAAHAAHVKFMAPQAVYMWGNTGRPTMRKDERLRSLKELVVSAEQVGCLTTQELVSMIPVLFLKLDDILGKDGEELKLLDMCASPGSKTCQILETILRSAESKTAKGAKDVNGSGSVHNHVVLANDVDWKRANVLTHQVQRLRSPSCIVVNRDAEYFPRLTPKASVGDKAALRSGNADPSSSVSDPLSSVSDPSSSASVGYFNRVLADVPCSGDGTIRKNRFIWPNFKLAGGHGLHKQQVRMAIKGLKQLDFEGIMVYSTCSLNPIENEAVVNSVLDYFNGPLKGRYALHNHLAGHSEASGHSDFSSYAEKHGYTVELLPVPAELTRLREGFKCRPGLANWLVVDPKTGDEISRDAAEKLNKERNLDFAKKAENGKKAESNKKSENGEMGDKKTDHPVNHGGDAPLPKPTIKPGYAPPMTMYPPSGSDKTRAQSLVDCCARFLPADMNTGGFFACAFVKKRLVGEKVGRDSALASAGAQADAVSDSSSESSEDSQSESDEASPSSKQEGGEDMVVDSQEEQSTEDQNPTSPLKKMRLEDGQVLELKEGESSFGRDHSASRDHNADREHSAGREHGGRHRYPKPANQQEKIHAEGFKPVSSAVLAPLLEFYGVDAHSMTGFAFYTHIANEAKDMYCLSETAANLLNELSHMRVVSAGTRVFSSLGKHRDNICEWRVAYEGLTVLDHLRTLFPRRLISSPRSHASPKNQTSPKNQLSPRKSGQTSPRESKTLDPNPLWVPHVIQDDKLFLKLLQERTIKHDTPALDGLSGGLVVTHKDTGISVACLLTKSGDIINYTEKRISQVLEKLFLRTCNKGK